ncbi:hypothetical protein JHK87_024186 [Glycine soja]|nr:hypothetical protein JHK87_024186 [Glycine soja]
MTMWVSTERFLADFGREEKENNNFRQEDDKEKRIVVILNKETILAEFEIIGNPKPYMDSDKPTVRASADCTWRICPGLVIVLLPKMQSHNNTQNFRPTIQPPYQPPPLYKGCGPVVKNEVPARIVPKAALNPYQCRWAIKARVTAKVDLRRYNNARGDGNIFLFDLLDSDGGEIRVLMEVKYDSYLEEEWNGNPKKNFESEGQFWQEVELTLWGEFCNREGQQLQEMVDTGSFLILAVKAGKVNDFSGKSIGSISTTQLFINPDFPEAHSLREWFDRVGKDSASLSISKDIIPGAVKNKVRKTVSQMKDEGLGRSDKPDWIIVRAAILFIKTDTFCCTACPLMIGDRRCNKKVTRSGNTRWQCDRCNQEFEEGKRLWSTQQRICTF